MLMMNILGANSWMLLAHRARLLESTIDLVPKAFAATLGLEIADKARSMLGTYQPSVSGGPNFYPAWAPLAEATMRKRRTIPGHNPAEQPLLDTTVGSNNAQGGLHSIQSSAPIQLAPAVVQFVVGYHASFEASKYMPIHELGDPMKNIPPRPVLGPAAIHVMQDGMADMIGPIAMNHFNILATGSVSRLVHSLDVKKTGVSGGFERLF